MEFRQHKHTKASKYRRSTEMKRAYVYLCQMVNHLIVPRDWKRFTPYAHRVKKWAQEDLQYIDEAVVDHLAFGRLPGYILPRLTEMEVMATSVSGLHLQTLLISPALESIAIWNNAPFVPATRQMNTFFRTLADRAPTLRKFVRFTV